MWPIPQETEEIFNGKIYFLCSDISSLKRSIIIFSSIKSVYFSDAFLMEFQSSRDMNAIVKSGIRVIYVDVLG